MAPNHDDQRSIRQYLLGQLSGENQQIIEARLLTENDLFEELEVGEDELIDEYLQGKLTEDERDRFAQLFLASPERHQKLQFARSLSRYLKTNATPGKSAAQPYPSSSWGIRNWTFSAAAALALVVVIAGSVALLRQSAPKQATTPTLATLTLNLSTSNRADPTQFNKVTLPLKAEALKISLRLPELRQATARYRVELLKDVSETRTLEVIEQDAQSVSVAIPARELSRGQYALRLFAINEDGGEQRINGSYFFSVE